MRRKEPFIPPRSAAWLATLCAIAALCVAWIAQYGFGLAPCELCYWQRYGYWAAIAVGVIACFTPWQSPGKFWALAALAASFAIVSAIAGFHAGVEYGWWRGFTSCTGDLGPALSAEDLLAAIENAPVVRCDQPAFVLFGLSMAGYNFFFALALAIFCAWAAIRTKP
jgi:disulfide bond formation protein DsbB